MTEKRIKELAEAIEKELRSMLRETGCIRVQQFIAEHIRTVAAEAREEGIEAAWIDVCGDCPKEGESVLVTWFREGMAKSMITCGHYLADPGEITWFRDWTSEVIQPTHWMPLPKPPAERLKEQGK